MLQMPQQSPHELQTGAENEIFKLDLSKLKISQDQIGSMQPLQLTEEQWKQVIISLSMIAREKFRATRFENLSPDQKAEAIRLAISPHVDESWGLKLKYQEHSGLKKAAETLSDGVGKCDDFCILYFAICKKLHEEGKFGLPEPTMLNLYYFDPKKKGEVGHANVVQFGLPQQNNHSFLIDFTVNTEVVPLNLENEELNPQSQEFRSAIAKHLNKSRSEETRILDVNLDVELYPGFRAADVIYNYDEGNSYRVEASKDGKSESDQIDLLRKSSESLTLAITISDSEKMEFPDAYAQRHEVFVKLTNIYRAKALQVKSQNLPEEEKRKAAIEFAKLSMEFEKQSQLDIEKLMSMKIQTYFSLNQIYLYQRSNKQGDEQVESVLMQMQQKRPYRKPIGSE